MGHRDQEMAGEVPFRLFSSAEGRRKPSVDMKQVLGKTPGAGEFHLSVPSCHICRVSALCF